MKIVVLDGYTLNPGDLDWKPLQALGQLSVHHRTAATDVVGRAVNCEILLTNKTILSRDSIARLPALRYIGVMASGYNVVDVRAAKEKGIVVTNVPGYGTDSVAQLVFAFALELLGHASVHIRAVREGAWATSRDWSFKVDSIQELAGKTLGIVGMGVIGKKVAQIGDAFGMHVIAAAHGSQPPVELEGYQVPRLPLENVLANSDVVTLHCPLTKETERMMNAERISRMKRTAILINTARGSLIDEPALADALKRGLIAGAALDVLTEEPPHGNNPLLTAPGCLITPHIAWASLEARARLLQIVVDNVEAFLDGNPINVVK